MPASPLKWGSQPKPTLSHVYALNCNPVKRKTSEYVQPSLNSCFEATPENIASLQSHLPSKRMCPWPQNCEPVSLPAQVADNAEMMDNSHQAPTHTTGSALHAPHSALVQYQQLSQSVLAQQEMESQQKELSVHSQEQSAMNPQHVAMDNMDFQSGMVMNINDDDGEIDDYTNACDAMDSEGAVDISQYGARVSGQHESHCFGQEQSPNSGNVRCYCRPTWDNISNSNSFFSDIY